MSSTIIYGGFLLYKVSTKSLIETLRFLALFFLFFVLLILHGWPLVLGITGDE